MAFEPNSDYYEYAGESALLGRRGGEWRVLCCVCQQAMTIPPSRWNENKAYRCGCGALIGYHRCKTFGVKLGVRMPDTSSEWPKWLGRLYDSMAVRGYKGAIITPVIATWPDGVDLVGPYRDRKNPKKLAREIMQAIKDKQCLESLPKKSARPSKRSATTRKSSKPGKTRSPKTRKGRAKS